MFLSEACFISLEFSETHFDLLVSNSIVVINFLRIVSTKSTNTQKIKMTKSENYFSIGFRTLSIFWDNYFFLLLWLIISKTMNLKIVSSFLEQLFGPKTQNVAIFERGCRSSVVQEKLINRNFQFGSDSCGGRSLRS